MYPLDFRHTDPAGDWPGREEDDLEPGAWRSAAEREVMFAVRGWTEGAQTELKVHVPTLAVVTGADEQAREALHALECVDASFQQRLQRFAQLWDVTPTMQGVAEAIAVRLLRPLEVEEDRCLDAYPCRLCEHSFESISDFRLHVQGQHSAAYADDLERAYMSSIGRRCWDSFDLLVPRVICCQGHRNDGSVVPVADLDTALEYTRHLEWSLAKPM